MAKSSGTRIYGASDDLIEFDGDLHGEVGCYGTDDADKGVLVMLSDGTVLEVKYCKRVSGVWAIDVLRKGELFDRFEPCADSESKPYSDQVFMKPGLKWGYSATESWDEIQ